jgi:predicted alpha/beta hydrolase family esterase
MNRAILLHGTCSEDEYFSDNYPSLSNSHWLPWLQKQLLMKDIIAQTPEMPYAYKPNYTKWKEEFERYPIDENTILVGHSCGGGFLVRWLSENKLNVGNVVLVAPWLDPKRNKTTDFFNFDIDPELYKRVKSLEIYLSNDDQDVIDSVDTLLKTIPEAQLHKFDEMGHFTYGEMGKHDFPELLESVLK